MSERTTSFFILLGGMLAVLALWALSILAVRRDTRKRRLTEMEQRAWTVATAVLPLFGFALYLAMRLMRAYLTPTNDGLEEGRLTSVRPGGAWRPAAPTARDASIPVENDRRRGKELPTYPAAQEKAASPCSLVVIDGPHLGQQFVINQLPAKIGRGPDVPVPLDADLQVSRFHAEIYLWNGMLRIRDTGSTHGTRINEKTVNDQPLHPGDRVRLGQSLLVVQEVP